MVILGSPWGALRSLLGASWEPLGRLLGLLGASWELLGGLLGSSWGAFMGHQHVQQPICCITCSVLKKCLFLEREHKIQQPQASWRLLVCLLGRLGSLLEALGTLLEHLKGILTLSWEPCWSLGRPKCENAYFSMDL